MKIVHVCLTGVYTDGWSYQENLLSKYHVKLGNIVTLIATGSTYDTKGRIVQTDHSDYVNEDGVKIIRLKEKKGNPNRRFRRFPDLYKTLEKEKPDIIFTHGCQFIDVEQVVKYKKKNKNVTIYVDNHADFSNSATNWLSKNILHKLIWKSCAHKLEPYTKKFYGVMPSRVNFLIELYHLPKEKVELLVMGADDERVSEALRPEVRIRVRENYHISNDAFLIVTGGKIDTAKKQILQLMRAVNNINNLKLLVFGSVVDELKEDFMSLCSDQVQYIGWIDAKDTDQYFAAADLVVFPGRHSVFWEQVAGMGIPMVVKNWPGTHHIDVGGNVKFIQNDSSSEIEHILKKIIAEDYYSMKMVAQTKGKDTFSYLNIAKKSIS